MTVNMPVEAINEKCLNCPELEIDILTTELYALSVGDTQVPEIKNYENKLRCTHVDRCRMVVKHMEEPEKKEAKKAAPRKKQASK